LYGSAVIRFLVKRQKQLLFDHGSPRFRRFTKLQFGFLENQTVSCCNCISNMSSEDAKEEAPKTSVTIYPYLSFKGNGSEAIEWYSERLGATVECKMLYGDGPPPHDEANKNCVMHAVLKIGNSTLMLSDVVGKACEKNGPVTVGNNIVLNIDWEDLSKMRTAFIAMSDGGKVIMPLDHQFWGATYGQFIDKFDITWSFNCHDAEHHEAKKPRSD
jgi:PhnB protein